MTGRALKAKGLRSGRAVFTLVFSDCYCLFDSLYLKRRVATAFRGSLCPFKVGDRVTVSLHSGQLVDGVVKGIVQKTDGVRLQVDYGQNQTALVHLWQVHMAK